jgi:hypothetical protein
VIWRGAAVGWQTRTGHYARERNAARHRQIGSAEGETMGVIFDLLFVDFMLRLKETRPLIFRLILGALLLIIIAIISAAYLLAGR